jgi:hypothetical protein
MPPSHEFDPNIAAYYACNNEPQRLTTGVGKLEFLRTQEIVRRYLPKPPVMSSTSVAAQESTPAG